MAENVGHIILVMLLRGSARWLSRSPIPAVSNKNMRQFYTALLVTAAVGPILPTMADWVHLDMAAHVGSIFVCVLLRGCARRLLGSPVGAAHNKNNDNMRRFGKALLIAAAAGMIPGIMAKCLDIFMAQTIGPVVVIFLLRGSTRRLLKAPTRSINKNAAREPAVVAAHTAAEEQAQPAAPSPSPPRNEAEAAGSPIGNQEQPPAALATASSPLSPVALPSEPAVPLVASPLPLRIKGGGSAPTPDPPTATAGEEGSRGGEAQDNGDGVVFAAASCGAVVEGSEIEQGTGESNVKMDAVVVGDYYFRSSER